MRDLFGGYANSPILQMLMRNTAVTIWWLDKMTGWARCGPSPPFVAPSCNQTSLCSLKMAKLGSMFCPVGPFLGAGSDGGVMGEDGQGGRVISCRSQGWDLIRKGLVHLLPALFSLPPSPHLPHSFSQDQTAGSETPWKQRLYLQALPHGPAHVSLWL